MLLVFWSSMVGLAVKQLHLQQKKLLRKFQNVIRVELVSSQKYSRICNVIQQTHTSHTQCLGNHFILSSKAVCPRRGGGLSQSGMHFTRRSLVSATLEAGWDLHGLDLTSVFKLFFARWELFGPQKNKNPYMYP